MGEKTIDTLREHLFAELESLRGDKPNYERAKAVCEVAGKLIESAKVEVAFLDAVGGRGSGFIPQNLLPPSRPHGGELSGPAVGGTGNRHR